MKTLITGTARGIGRATAEKFLKEGHEVVGLDVLPASVNLENYTHIVMDVSEGILPEIAGVEVLVNNAGVLTFGERDIDVNLKAAIRVTEKYGVQKAIRAVVNVASASGSTGSEFPHYAASKGGLIAYTKNVAGRIAAFGATCNSVSPGGVITDMNEHILNDKALTAAVYEEALLKKWATPEEIAEWIYFIAVVNKSMTVQDVLIDNGEASNFNFIW